MSEAPLPENTSYDDAVRELQDILQMQGSELSIDALTSKLQRASALLDFCQQRLTKTEPRFKQCSNDSASKTE